ncbi:hypothetical protein QQS21_007213 [Conoideocrella luteorostrata]|uniref:Zn(2)-C6 fungal-type domain-containing protein n=1 Tax=Conoideocrella luteorostrata TaxID=1105319 RepID=A0AAJ0CM01_9HYPO|nr:hypothetical protein QQS21_007213 [Conoideocrella luteorostrata]
MLRYLDIWIANPRDVGGSGCNYCKEKKKKCNEARPTCSRCYEHGEECLYEPAKPRQRRKIETAQKTASASQITEPPEHSSESSMPQTDTAAHNEVVRTAGQCAVNFREQWDTSAFAAETRNEYYPFGTLVGYSDVGEQLPFDEFDTPSHMSLSPSLALITPAVNPSPLLEFCTPAFEEFSRDFNHRLLIDHFCNTLSHLIVLREDEGNPFQQLVLPLAHNSPAVRGALYALASAHLEGKGVNRLENAENSVHFHNEAIRNLATLIGKGDGVDKNELLATIILIVYYEVLVQRRRSNLVENHLKGAMAIMRNSPSQGDRTGIFLEEAFRFYDVISALSSGTSPVSDAPVPSTFARTPQSPSQISNSPAGGVNALLGLATSLWPIIHTLSGLLALKTEMEESSAHGDMSSAADLRDKFDAECAAVESSLDEWQPILPSECELYADLAKLSSGSRAKLQELQSIFNTALAYRHSALVYLYRTIYDSPRAHPVVQHHASVSLVHCKATVQHEGPMGALLWPLFVASCEAIEPSDRELAREAFRGIDHRQGMTNIGRAWEAVREVWNRADEAEAEEVEVDGEPTNRPKGGRKDLWRKVSEDMGMAIVFG